MGVEFFKSRQRHGWRLRVGAIEFTRAAVFPTQEQALANALADTRAAMESLGIIEATPPPPPDPDPVLEPAAWVESLPGDVARLRWANLTPTGLERDGKDAGGWPADGSGWKAPDAYVADAVAAGFADFSGIPADWDGTFTVTHAGGQVVLRLSDPLLVDIGRN